MQHQAINRHQDNFSTQNNISAMIRLGDRNQPAIVPPQPSQGILAGVSSTTPLSNQIQSFEQRLQNIVRSGPPEHHALRQQVADEILSAYNEGATVMNLNCLQLYKLGKQASAFIHVLAEQTQFKELQLLGNHLGHLGKHAPAFARALSQLTHLQKLDLRYNFLGNLGKGAPAFVQALTPLTQLQHLNLLENNIGQLGKHASDFANALGHFANLKYVNLAINDLETLGEHADGFFQSVRAARNKVQHTMHLSNIYQAASQNPHAALLAHQKNEPNSAHNTLLSTIEGLPTANFDV